MSLFETKITVSSDTPIIALSDIHADIDSLIIALRDCAQVIKKKPNQNVIKPDGTEFVPTLTLDDTKRTEENIRHDAGDQLLEYLLQLDLNVPENDELFKKNVDLGYEWSGDKSHVVIIGDILDGIRASSGRVQTPYKSSLNEYVHQYPQVEVKILMFLNHLDEIANIDGGRVIKLIGNHEHMNFKASFGLETYAFANDIKQGVTYFQNELLKENKTKVNEPTYYEGISRNDYFNIDQPGYNLYTERGTGVLLLIDNEINNIIFCHGTLTNKMTYEEIDNINEIINNNTLKSEYTNRTLSQISNLFINGFRDSKVDEDILWGREMGSDEKINRRFDTSKDYCSRTVEPIINKFCENGDCDSDKIKIILGHCTQNYSTFFDGRNRTFKNIMEENDKIIKYDSSEIHEGLADLKNNVIYGITMECDSPSPHNSNPGDNKIIYRVDVASSRGFDQNITTHISSDNPVIDGNIMKKYLHSRTPQILYMKNGNLKIIKSKYENTRKHQPRIWLEQTIDGIGNYVVPPPPSVPVPVRSYSQVLQGISGGYKEKYLKYKQKYLQLKKSL